MLSLTGRTKPPQQLGQRALDLLERRKPPLATLEPTEGKQQQ